MSKVFLIESVYLHSMMKTFALYSIKLSNHVAHQLLYRPESKGYVWSNHISVIV